MSQNTMGHMRADIKRSEKVLDTLVTSTGLTEAGKEWLIAAFDPFHDRDLDCTGYPDANSSNSMLQVITLSAQVSGPAALAADEFWDCHIVDWPFMGTVGAKISATPYGSFPIGNTASGVFFQNAGTILNNAFGGLGIYTSKTNLNDNDVFGANLLTLNNLTPSSADLKDPYRIIGKGFEVYNTSPDLYKSGACLVYKQPVADYNDATTATIVSVAPAAFIGAADVLLMDAPPTNVSEALRLPNSRQWEAREGCYVISPLHHGNTPVHTGNWTVPLYYKDTPADSTLWGPGFATQSFSPFTGLTPSTSILKTGDQHWTNFDQCGSIFTGLTKQSTLTINYRFFVEVFPGSSSSLANYAHPSPQYDPAALKLYAEICHKAPVGVEVKYNGLGDWFIDGIKAVADTVMPIAGKVMKASGHPGVKAVGKMLAAKKKKEPINPKKNGKLSLSIPESSGKKIKVMKARASKA